MLFIQGREQQTSHSTSLASFHLSSDGKCERVSFRFNIGFYRVNFLADQIF